MPNQIYFIDSKLNDYQTIVNSLSSTDIYYIIDSSSDGLTQMSKILSNYSNLDSIHVYSHGDVGSLNIGNSIYDNTNISNYKIELENIGKSLSSTGDILLYGCNVGQNEVGKNFINQIAQYTQADVAGSDDLTGNKVLGGDWDLEVISGVVETQVNTVEEYKSTLANNTAPTFKVSDGKVTTDFGESIDYGISITLQSDGKILVAGKSNIDFAIARYNSNGTLDTSFSDDGKVTTDFGGGIDYGKGISLQSDGKILVGGYSGSDFALARYNTNGTLDSTFSGDGLVTTDFGYSDYGQSITLQSDGKILVAGSSNSNFAIARYNSDGSLDTNFDGDGKVTTDFTGYNDSGNSITVQSDGKILVAGGSSNSYFALARYNTNGTLDTTFSGDGLVVTTDFGSFNGGKSITLQSDGKILVAGMNSHYNNFALARYNTNGTLDTTFSDDGLVVTTDFGGLDSGQSITLQSNGKILVAGSSGSDFAIARYNSDGSLDTTFSGDGLVTTDFGSFDYGYSVTLQSDGKILVAGESNSDFALVRYNSDGSLDSSFGIIDIGTVAENSALSTVIYKAIATDVDANTTLTYSLSGTDASLLNINSTTGDVTLKTSADYETRKSYSFNVIASDGSLSDTKAITVNVTDVNEVINVNHAPTITSVSTGTVTENVSTSTVIYKAIATDVDANTTLTYSLTGTDASLLNINSTTGDVTLKTSADYETRKSYSFNVIASDGSLSATKSIIVNVTDVNEVINVNHTPTITSSTTGTVAENSATTTVIYKAIATDADANTTLTYSLSGTDASLLNINSTTGDVTLKTSADYETRKSYSFNVIASDGSLTATKVVVVSVNNVNEFSPTITSVSTGTVTENVSTSTVIYKAIATDPDANTTLAYSLSGTDASLLNINSSTGDVTLKSSANYETKNSYSFNVIASDGSLTSSKAVVVNVTNVNETPTSANKTITINEDARKILTLADFYFKDEDSNSTLSKVKITQLETKGTLKLNGLDVALNQEILATDINAGKLIFTPTSNEFGTSYSNFKFQVSDGTKYSTSSYTTMFNVTNLADERNSSTSYILSEPDVVLNLTGTAATGTGNALDNRITGNSAVNTLIGLGGNDILDGKIGADIMLGGAGADTYYVDNSGDKVYETTTTSSTTDAGGGMDNVNSSVSYTLTSFVEDLTLTGSLAINGTGNILGNVIYGNSAVNTLSGLGGADLLDGKAGADIMLGGAGNDMYLVDNKDDKVYETKTTSSTSGDAGGWCDTVNSSVTYTLSNYVENLRLTGTYATNGTGNSSNNVIYGNELANTLSGLAGNDTLDGSYGADIMLGGAGNDMYFVDYDDDKVYETKTTTSTSGDAGGYDAVYSSVTYTLSSYVEQLLLDGISAINGTGNALNNIITGNNAVNTLNGLLGNDTLNGGLGNDILIGGAGKDIFVFNNTATKYNVDTIKDFSVADDTIHLENAIFTNLATGALGAGNFVSNGTKALDTNDYLIYNKGTGQLFYDADGSGAGTTVLFATIENRVALTNADFTVI